MAASLDENNSQPNCYCVAPFRQLYIDNTGVSACCRLQKSAVTISQWYQSPELKNLQDKFLSGQKPVQCNQCWQQEKHFGHSLRTENNAAYDNQQFTDTKMNFIDYRSNNVCNFKCRSCEPTFSNGIAQEVNKHPALMEFFKPTQHKVLTVDQSNFEYVLANLDQVDRLMFTGGEPTVMPDVKALLQKVVQQANRPIGVLITTNGSFTDPFWYDLVDKIPNLHWTLSLDAVGSSATIIRHGTDWDTVSKNAMWLARHAHSLTVNTVVSNLSLLQLLPLMNFVTEMKLNSNGTNGCEHRFHVCSRPDHLACDNLPPDLAAVALQYLEHCLQHVTTAEHKNLLPSLIALFVNHKPNIMLWQKSERYNQHLDQIRQQDHTVLLNPSW